MPTAPSTPALPIPQAPNTVQQVITNALTEIGALSMGETPAPEEANFALSKFNQLLDSWSTRAQYIFVLQLLSQNPATGPNPNASFLLSPGLIPHTIGPANFPNAAPPIPTFIVPGERPVRIKNINILLNNVSPVVRFPLQKRDKDWWATNRVQTIQTTLPTDFYYRPDWPLGSIFFWPVPNFAYGAEIEVESFLEGAAQLGTVFEFPAGYELAITLTLAQLLRPAFKAPADPTLDGAAAQARQAIAGLNADPPRINLDDFGGPSTGKQRPSFNYRTGYSTR